jgi:hypothetical protein
MHFGEWLGLIVLAVLGWMMYRTATQADTHAA